LLTIVAITGQCEFDRAVGDTSSFARVVHPSAVPALSTERLYPPRSRTPKLSLPHSRLAQVLLPHQRLDSTGKQQPAVSLVAPTRRIPPLGHGLRNDTHRRGVSKRKRTVITDAHLPARVDAAPCGRAGPSVSEHRPREARPAHSPASRDLSVRVVTPNPSCHRGGARLRGTVLESASCVEEQRAREYELVLAERTPGRSPADTEKRSRRAGRGSSRLGEFTGWAARLGSSAHFRGHDSRVCRGLIDGRIRGTPGRYREARCRSWILDCRRASVLRISGGQRGIFSGGG